MTKFIIWIAHHPDVVVSFNKNSILDLLRVRMQLLPGRLTIERVFDDLEYPWLVEDEDYLIEVLNYLYYKLKKEENDENDKK